MSEPLGLISRQGEAISLRGVEVDARLIALVAETTLRQHYRNDTGSNLEVAYTFPLPVDGVLLDFEVTLGGHTHRGHVLPRRDAEEHYEDAVGQGDAAFRLQQVEDGLYTASLGNLKPGEEVEIRLRYGETLRWQAGRLRYRLPTVIAPRYGEPTGMQPWQKPITSLVAEYPFVLRLQVLGDLSHAAFECPSHRLAFAAGEGCTTLTLQGQAALDRDFVLDIRTGEIKSLGVVADAMGARVALLNLLPAEISVEGQGRNYVLLLDCSGSMAGDSLTHAKEGVHLALKSLKPADHFAVIGFGSTTQAFDQALQPANRKNLQLAESFVTNLPDLGGTEMAEALEQALGYGCPLDILLLTDGECWDLEATAEKAREQGSRIFTVGIGSAVAEDTVRMLADTTGGVCELVTPNEDMADRIAAHFARMRQPRITALDVDWGQDPAWIAQSGQAHFAGDSHLIWAQLPQPAGEVRATLRFEQGLALIERITLTHSPELADTLVRLAAAVRLPNLDDDAQVDWALRYQLVSEETDYLVIVERAEAEKVDGLPELQVVPQMLAAGWGGTGSVMDTGIRFSLRRGPASAFLAEPAFDMASPMRCSRARQPRSGRWTTFLQALEAYVLAEAALPPDAQQLVRLGLPDMVAEIVRRFLNKGDSESLIVRIALYLLQDYLDIEYPEHVERLVFGAPPERTAVEQSMKQAFDALDNEVWEDVDGTLVTDELDIPVFLRKQAE